MVYVSQKESGTAWDTVTDAGPNYRVVNALGVPPVFWDSLGHPEALNSS